MEDKKKGKMLLGMLVTKEELEALTNPDKISDRMCRVFIGVIKDRGDMFWEGVVNEENEKRKCWICKREFDEEDLDMVEGEWVCRKCEDIIKEVKEDE